MAETSKSIPPENALLYLLGCAVNSLVPQPAVLCGMDWKAVYLLSHRHTVAAAACMAVEHGLAAAPFPLDEAQKAVLTCWQDTKNRAIRKNILLDADRTALGEYCEDIGCWYLPLKGAVLKDLYPRVGMRQMADNDILFDAAFQLKICDWFVARGYKAESVGCFYHDVYCKKPIYNFELHTALFSGEQYPEWAAYYAEVQNRLLPVAPGRYERQFSKEDFYLYITLHEYKHFSAEGTGVRNLLDRYVYCGQYAAPDWDYIRGELQTLGLAGFEAEARALSEALFTDPDAFLQAQLPPKQRELLAYYLGSGTYGNTENSITHKLMKLEPQADEISAGMKARYLLRRIFPTQKKMLDGYPKLARHKILLPFCYTHRLVIKAVTRRKAIREETKIVMKS